MKMLYIHLMEDTCTCFRCSSQLLFLPPSYTHTSPLRLSASIRACVFSSSAYPNPLSWLVPLSTGSLTDITWCVCMCVHVGKGRGRGESRYGGGRKRKGGEVERGKGEEGDYG